MQDIKSAIDDSLQILPQEIRDKIRLDALSLELTDECKKLVDYIIKIEELQLRFDNESDTFEAYETQEYRNGTYDRDEFWNRPNVIEHCSKIDRMRDEYSTLVNDSYPLFTKFTPLIFFEKYNYESKLGKLRCKNGGDFYSLHLRKKYHPDKRLIRSALYPDYDSDTNSD